MMTDFVRPENMPYYRSLLGELLDLSEGLTHSEVEFIENLSHWQADFTVKQAQYLEDIHNRRT